jgi:hypothetical protein
MKPDDNALYCTVHMVLRGKSGKHAVSILYNFTLQELYESEII